MSPLQAEECNILLVTIISANLILLNKKIASLGSERWFSAIPSTESLFKPLLLNTNAVRGILHLLSNQILIEKEISEKQHPSHYAKYVGINAS